MAKFFTFEPKFGWSELVATAALLFATLPYFFPSDPAKEITEKSPKLVVIQAELKPAAYSTTDQVFHIGLRNAGRYPATGLEFAFDVYYLNKKDPTADDLRVYLDPTLAYDLEVKRQYAYLRLRHALPPGEEVWLSVFGRPIGVTVITDYGSTLYLSPPKPVSPENPA
jgi:hypothetical protein